MAESSPTCYARGSKADADRVRPLGRQDSVGGYLRRLLCIAIAWVFAAAALAEPPLPTSPVAAPDQDSLPFLPDPTGGGTNDYSHRKARLLELDPPEWLIQGLITVREAIAYFLKGSVPDLTGQEKPNAFEWPIDQFQLRIFGADGKPTRFAVIPQGVMNLKFLGGSYYYSEAQMGAGLHVDLLDPKDPTSVLALRVSPAYLEIAWVRLGAGAGRSVDENATLPSGAIPGLPSQLLLGGSVGLEAAKTFGAVTPGARVYARPLWAVANLDGTRGQNEFGVSAYASVYAKIELDQLLPKTVSDNLSISVTPSAAYFNRGSALGYLYAWDSTKEGLLGPQRSVGDMTPVFQGLLFIDIKERLRPAIKAAAFDGPTGPR